jgi:hypothetical protein
MSNLLDAAQPAAPTPQRLMEALHEIMEKEKSEKEADSLFGNLYEDEEMQKPGSKKVQLAGMRAMIEFESICKIVDRSFEKVDDLFLAFFQIRGEPQSAI